MYKFGNIPPRKLRDRGVASLLGPECIVFYDSLFTMMHLGRVTDLLAARLRSEKVDEFKLRALLLLEFVNAYRAQDNTFSPLKDPLVIECGIDAEKIALGITFTASDVKKFNVDGIETLLNEVYQHADHLMVRADQKALKFEIIALLAIPEKFSFEKAPLTLERTTESDNFFSDTFNPTPAKQYFHLADLDYPTILREDRAKLKAKEKFATGEAIAQDFQNERPALREIRVKSSVDSLPEETYLVKGYLNKSQPFKATIPASAPEEEKAPAETGINFKQRYFASQKTIEAAQADAKKLEGKIDELTRQVQVLQNGPGDTAPGELKALKSKHNELTRQHLQLKAINEQLNARLAAPASPTASKTNAPDPVREETARKLEITARLALDQAKELKALRDDLKTAKSALEVSQRMLSQKKAG